MSPAERLVGREAVLAAAGSALRDAGAGTSQLLLVGGEAGIGKTAVLTALVDMVGPGCMILRGACWEGHGTPPYWPWSQVLQATGWPPSSFGEAGRILQTESAPGATLDPGATADAQFRVFDAVAGCLAELARERLVLVVLDDLQWADEPTVRLLGFLARALTGCRVLLAGAYRETEAPPELLTLAASAQQLTLAGLSQAEVAEMAAAVAGAALPEQVSSQLWRRSGGNPFFVRELTRLLLAQGSLTEQTAIPRTVAETLRRRLARLSTRCVRALDLAAIVGRDVDIDLLVQLNVVTDEAEALDLLDEGRRAGVISGTRDRPRFAHDLYRETILSGLGPATTAELNLAVATALQARSAGTAQIAAHFLAAGPSARRQAIDYSIRAAREATARLGHDQACAHYQHALRLVAAGAGDHEQERCGLLLELAAAQDRAGRTASAEQVYREVGDLAQRSGDEMAFANAALGLHSLGHRIGSSDVRTLDMLRLASARLAAGRGSPALQSRVAGAEARELRHGAIHDPTGETVRAAQRAVRLAAESGDAQTIAVAKLALQDSMWVPGSSRQRLPVITEMLAAAGSSGDADLIAEAHLLRAAALLELGDPTGRDELATYVSLADTLGHARGRWGALTRRATLAQIAGRAREAADLGEQALALGRAIGVPDALGCFCTSRWSLLAMGVPEPRTELAANDPLWPMFPIFRAWPPAVRRDVAATAAALGDFSVLDIAESTGTEALAAAAVVFAVAGNSAQRTWVYRQLLPHAGTHVLVSGCASYHAAVDHHLGALAAALGDTARAEQHFRAALAMHERLGAAAWVRLTARALTELTEPSNRLVRNEFRLVDGYWRITFGDVHAQLPDAKGLRDIAAIIAAREGIHVLTLVGSAFAPTGADPILDDVAKARFKARLNDLSGEIQDADDAGDSRRAEKLRSERTALIDTLATAAGLGGRDRRLGDESERARKTVSARVRDSLAKIDHVHPGLADHLRRGLRMGTTCFYTPVQPTAWKLS